MAASYTESDRFVVVHSQINTFDPKTEEFGTLREQDEFSGADYPSATIDRWVKAGGVMTREQAVASSRAVETADEAVTRLQSELASALADQAVNNGVSSEVSALLTGPGASSNADVLGNPVRGADGLTDAERAGEDRLETSLGDVQEPSGNASRAEWAAYAKQEHPEDSESIDDEANVSRNDLRDKYRTPGA